MDSKKPRAHSPYTGRHQRTFWRTAVSGRQPDELTDLFIAPFALERHTRIATAGSCFAQHIARSLRSRGYNVLDAERPPSGLSNSEALRFGYNMYSARYGNIYHVRQLLQLVKESFGIHSPQEFIWEKSGRFYDALRPSVEPVGLASPELVVEHRRRHLKRVKELMGDADVFVFTMGLTEAWVHQESGTVYPTAPGTIAGEYDEAKYTFKNFRHSELLADFREARELIRRVNPGIRFLLTVSPVGLAATAEEDHILVASTRSKATLRSVAGELEETYDDVTYFPSYEIVTGAPAGNRFLDSTLREVTREGVETVMSHFMSAFGAQEVTRQDVPETLGRSEQSNDTDRVICEDVLLEAFSA